jgi:hypothetical protein
MQAKKRNQPAAGPQVMEEFMLYVTPRWTKVPRLVVWESTNLLQGPGKSRESAWHASRVEISASESRKGGKKTHTIDANWVVGLEGVRDAGGGQEGNNDGDHNKQGSEHRDATSTGGTPSVHNLSTETGEKDQSEVHRKDAGKQKGSDGKSLNKLQDAEDGLVARVSSSDWGLLAVKVCWSSPLLKGPSDIGTVVKESVWGRGRRWTSHLGNKSDLLAQRVPVHDGRGNGDAENGQRQEGSETVENTKWGHFLRKLISERAQSPTGYFNKWELSTWQTAGIKLNQIRNAIPRGETVRHEEQKEEGGEGAK